MLVYLRATSLKLLLILPAEGSFTTQTHRRVATSPYIRTTVGLNHTGRGGIFVNEFYSGSDYLYILALRVGG